MSLPEWIRNVLSRTDHNPHMITPGERFMRATDLTFTPDRHEALYGWMDEVAGFTRFRAPDEDPVPNLGMEEAVRRETERYFRDRVMPVTRSRDYYVDDVTFPTGMWANEILAQQQRMEMYPPLERQTPPPEYIEMTLNAAAGPTVTAVAPDYPDEDELRGRAHFKKTPEVDYGPPLADGSPELIAWLRGTGGRKWAHDKLHGPHHHALLEENSDLPVYGHDFPEFGMPDDIVRALWAAQYAHLNIEDTPGHLDMNLCKCRMDHPFNKSMGWTNKMALPCVDDLVLVDIEFHVGYWNAGDGFTQTDFSTGHDKFYHRNTAEYLQPGVIDPGYV